MKNINYYFYVAVSLVSELKGATATWNANSTQIGNWATASNWNPVAVPAQTSDVRIQNGGTVLVSTASATARTTTIGYGLLKIDAGGTLTNAGISITNGDFLIQGGGKAYTGYYGNIASFTPNILGDHGGARATVTGANSVWETSRSPEGMFAIGEGFAASGVMNIEAGGKVISDSVRVATGDANGAILVKGSGSFWIVKKEIQLGDDQQVSSLATLEISGGGAVECEQLYMEGYSTSSSMDTASSITVRNTGSFLKVNSFIKNSTLSFGTKTNRIDVFNGGKISCPRVHLSPFGGTSWVSISGDQLGRGVFEVGGFLNGYGFASIRINGGVIRLTENNEEIFQKTYDDSVSYYISSESEAIFDTQSFSVGTAQVIQGGAVTKTGSGTLKFAAANTYSGATLVSAGRLLVENITGSATGSGQVTVKTGATIGGTGRITPSSLVVESGGVVSPGSDGVGILSISGNCAIAGGLAIDVSGTNCDTVTVIGSLDLTGGSLSVNGTPISGVPYTIATYTGALTGTLVVPSGYVLNTVENGKIKVSFGTQASGYATWAQATFSASQLADSLISGPADDPDKDGLVNLLECAFNTSPLTPSNLTLSPATGTKGFPLISTVGSGTTTRLRIEYIRRKTGFSYAPEVSGSLFTSGWTAPSGNPTVTSIDAIWERVTVEDTAITGQLKRFGRVKVTSN